MKLHYISDKSVFIATSQAVYKGDVYGNYYFHGSRMAQKYNADVIKVYAEIDKYLLNLKNEIKKTKIKQPWWHLLGINEIELFGVGAWLLSWLCPYCHTIHNTITKWERPPSHCNYCGNRVYDHGNTNDIKEFNEGGNYMKEIKDWDNVKASGGDFERLAPGGYVCRITAVEDIPYNEETEKGAYLKMEYDIAEGDFAGFHKKNAEQFGWWGGTFYRSYKESAKGMFKAFTNAVEGSNNYTWNWDENTLIGLIVGLVLGEEEYEKNNGDIGTRLYVKNVKTAEAIRDGNFKVPEPKKLVEESPAPVLSELKDDDIPF